MKEKKTFIRDYQVPGFLSETIPCDLYNINGNGQELCSHRPAFVLIHGGGFMAGFGFKCFVCDSKVPFGRGCPLPGADCGLPGGLPVDMEKSKRAGCGPGADVCNRRFAGSKYWGNVHIGRQKNDRKLFSGSKAGISASQWNLS